MNQPHHLGYEGEALIGSIIVDVIVDGLLRYIYKQEILTVFLIFYSNFTPIEMFISNESTCHLNTSLFLVL